MTMDALRGLTQEGQGLVNAMMDRGMLLDAAHLHRAGQAAIPDRCGFAVP